MENVNEMNNPNIYDSKAKLEAIHQDIKRLMERSNQEYLDLMLANFKKDFINSLTSYVADDIESGLERGMVDPCEMRPTCKSRFTEFLNNNADLIRQDSVSKEVIDEKKAELSEIRKSAPFDKCDICFSEVNTLFDKQLNLISSLQIYRQMKKKNQIFPLFLKRLWLKVYWNLYPINRDYRYSNLWPQRQKPFPPSLN